MPIILDGKKLSAQLTQKLAKRISKLARKPKLVIIQVGSHKESNTYIQKKENFAEEIGAIVIHKKYDKAVRERVILADISKYNSDSSVHGIMVQLPLPKHINASRILESISPDKDVDGLTSSTLKPLFDNAETFLPATTQGIITLLKHYKIALAGKRVVLVGDSKLVGRPTALALLNRRATVTLCNIHTEKLEAHTKLAQILIVAVGHPGLITSKHVSKGQTLIDVGITVYKDKILGDVDRQDVEGIVAALTPVPGGVGPMTVYSLFENLVKAYTNQTRR